MKPTVKYREQTDEMRARLKEAAIKGGNKEVLALCIGFGTDKYSGKEKVEYVYGTSFPRWSSTA